ncbi:MAG: GNAT family N-acetyltransferase [Actinobacteria bacterium]|nr:GNAT family N-acetyltransferase [Actinomycetota bacterium]
MEFQSYNRGHLDGVLSICALEGWKSYVTDHERTHRVLTAPGVTTVVAIENGEICGFAQVQSDGEIQAHLSVLAVKEDYRRQGIGQKLIARGFQKAGGTRIDLITDDSQEFYQSMAHSAKFGFRLYPDAEQIGGRVL